VNPPYTRSLLQTLQVLIALGGSFHRCSAPLAALYRKYRLSRFYNIRFRLYVLTYHLLLHSVTAMHRGQSAHQLPLPVLDSVPEYPSTYSSHQSMIPAHGSYVSPNPNTYLDHSVSSRNSSRPSTSSSLASARYHPEAPPNASPYGSSGGSYLQPSGGSSESYGAPRSYSSQSYESEWNSTSSYGSTVGPGVPASRNMLGDRLNSHESSSSSHRYP